MFAKTTVRIACVMIAVASLGCLAAAEPVQLPSGVPFTTNAGPLPCVWIDLAEAPPEVTVMENCWWVLLP